MEKRSSRPSPRKRKRGLYKSLPSDREVNKTSTGTNTNTNTYPTVLLPPQQAGYIIYREETIL